MTGALIAGAVAFGLMALSDELAVRREKKGAGALFVAGDVLLAAVTLLLILRQGTAALAGPWRLLCLLLAAAGLLLLFYTILFALPHGGSKAMPTALPGRLPLVDTGVFALCRHPGVLWLGIFYAGLWGALGGAALGLAFILFTGLDVLYVLWQDRCVFPLSISNYTEYQKCVPFLLPNRRSVCACLSGKHSCT